MVAHSYHLAAGAGHRVDWLRPSDPNPYTPAANADHSATNPHAALADSLT